MKKILLFLMFALFCLPWAANAQQSLPYSYGFEDNDLATDGWTTQNPSGLNANEFGINAAAAKSGSYGFRFSSYSDRGESTQYLISPELVAPNGVIVQFYYSVSSSYTDGETFQVGYSTTDDNISSFTFGSEINATNTSWEQTEELVFPAGTKYVAVYYSANYQYRLYVDDFSFTAAPSCLKPTLSNEVILSMENASVQWTENGTATNWELQYSTNADFSGATTINRSGIPAYAISDLSAATTYYARVRANCGGGDYSDWSNVISFTTWSCEQPTVVEYDLADSYGDGWNGNAIQIFDGCGDLVETLTIASGYSNSGTLDLCGDYYQFVWVSGSYANETSFTLTVNGTAIYSQQSGNDFTDGQELHTIGIQPPVKPTSLTAGTPGANEVQLSWTENGTATTWQICINDDEDNLVVANSNPFTLTGLNAVTAYTVKVRSTDGTSASCWSNVVSFTTDSQCPTPNGLNVTNLMPTSATLNWQGEADSYNVRYGVAGGEVAVFEDGFENGLENWTIISNGAYTGTTWQQFNVDEFGNEGLTNHNGSYVTMSRSWGGNSVGDVSVDNWLITPQVALDGDLKYWVINDDGNGYAEQYAIYVSTTSNSISDFTLLYTPQNDATTWTEHVVDLRSFNGALGYIAIRHNDYGKDFLFIDDFGIYATQDAGEWINATSTTNSLDITGLTSETNYMFQVQAVCGAEGESSWTASATFTTLDACAVPTDLTAEVTGNTAKLSWTGVQENYNVQYREVDPTVPATIILNIPSDVWGDGSGYQMLIDADATAYGTIIPETGGLTTSGDASEETYAEFEYKLPTDADGSCSTSNILVEGSLSIEIPAGTYDWCITNPTSGDRIWIAASNGNVGGRQDDYVFEPGTTYEFTIYVSGTNDAVDVTITDNNEWAIVEGINNPYTLSHLSAETTYKYKVQGVNCDGNGGTTDWSASATFTTEEAPAECGKILVDEENPEWSEDFEDDAAGITTPYTGILPACWSVPMEYTSAEGDVTPPQVYYKPDFNATDGGSYSLRMRYRSMLAMPELDENVDFEHLKMGLYVRQSFWSYQLEIGVVTDIENPDESYTPVALVNNSDKNVHYFECNFASVKDLTGEGRYIVFKNVGGSEGDLYCNNYLDDITLTYVDNEGVNCQITESYTEDFEAYLVGAEPDCWEVIEEYVTLESSTRPQVYGNYNTTAGGSNSLRLKNRCMYAMPAFGEYYSISNFTMTFNLRQPKSIYRLQVGLVDAEGNFNLVKTFKCSNTTDMQPMSVSFSNLDFPYTDDMRVAFRNTLVPGTGMSTEYLDYSINYIDDINFSYEAKGKVEANADAFDANADLESIEVYPNPTTGNLYIDAMNIQKVECYNQMGQLVRVYDNVLNSIDLNNLSEGVYTLRITVPQGVTVRKVVKK